MAKEDAIADHEEMIHSKAFLQSIYYKYLRYLKSNFKE
jgi:hypothetical protein